MSSFLCFICHNTVNADTNEVTREKYKEVVGINLCPDSHLCYICHHMLNKLWLFKTICFKRSLEYPVLFSEKGTINLQQNEIQTIIVCNNETCLPNNTTQLYVDNRDHNTNSNDYFKLEHDHNNFEEYLRDATESVTFNTPIENVKEETNDNDCNNDSHSESNDSHYESNDSHSASNGSHSGSNDSENVQNFVDNDDDLFDFELNKQSDELETNAQIDDDVNYEGFDEERSECLNEIRNGETKQGTTKKKTKSKKSKKKDFEKILLSTEEQKAELEAQRRSKKYAEAEFKCYNCALGFLFKDTYQAHMMRHEESNGEYRCSLCSLRFATSAVLRSHTALHSVRYKCSRCARHIRARRTHTHARHCHNKSSAATCHLCGRVFQDGSGLQQHLKRFHSTKTSSRTYSCSVCGKTYTNQAAVRTHMIKHIHRKFSCDQCPSTFSSPYTLTQHKKTHSSEGQHHVCSTCGVGYSSRKSLLAHKRNSINHQQRAYECPICSRTCPNERALNSHISGVHSATKSFACATCDARYSSRKSLVRHSRSHTTPPVAKPAVCHFCGNSFKGKSKLNRHLREVCKKDKLEEELSSYYEQQSGIHNLT